MNKVIDSTVAEQSVLACLIIDGSKIESVSDIISVDDFHIEIYKIIYNAMLQMKKNDVYIDIISLSEDLSQNNELDKIGGMNYLTTLSDCVPSSRNFKRYAEVILEKNSYRNIQKLINDINKHNGIAPVSLLIDLMKDETDKLSERLNSLKENFQTMKPLLLQNMEKLQELYSREDLNETIGYTTGLKDVDSKTNGLQKGDLITVAGRPSMGKTAFVMGIAEHIAYKYKENVAVFSFEMDAKQLTNRLISSIGKINSTKMKTGNLSDQDWERYSKAFGKLNESPIHIDDGCSMTIFELRARAKKLKERLGSLGLIVVDHIGLMKPSNSNGNRVQDVSEITRELKNLARELDCPIIQLSQLNRNLEQRPNKRPIMSDLRESGSIEQDSNIIFFIYRDEVYNPDTEYKGIAEIILAKNRDGEIGTVNAAFLGEYTKFENLQRGN